ncbi:MAG: hypothetical protein L0H74_07635, partial [Brachybacterium sp.]|nr:hypothetical protein [Brachybacterium sp.]
RTRGEIHQLEITSFGTELTCELLIPHDVPHSGLVVVVPFYDTPSVLGEPTVRTRLAGKDPAAGAHGLQLAEAGHAVLAVPWWFEHIAAADSSTAGAGPLDARYGRAAERHRREQPMTALGRSVGDLMLAVTALEEAGLAPGARLAAFGHSLGGKLALHLAALDTRIDAAAAHEPGLGFAHSNWADPWYLDGDLPLDRDQDELLGLVAPRPFLLAGGGDGDGVHTLDLFRTARRNWPDERGLDLLLHDGGHPMPPHVMAAVGAWFQERLPR